MGVVALFEAFSELDEELNATFHILQIDDFAGGVHVAERNADEASRDAAPAHLDSASIGACRAGVGFDLAGNFQFFAAATSRAKIFGLMLAPRQRMGPPPSVVSPYLRLSQSG